MSIWTIIILVNLVGFSMLFIYLLTRRREPSITTITRSLDRTATVIESRRDEPGDDA